MQNFKVEDTGQADLGDRILRTAPVQASVRGRIRDLGNTEDEYLITDGKSYRHGDALTQRAAQENPGEYMKSTRATSLQ